MKKCRVCKSVKEIAEFPVRIETPDGHGYICRQCRREDARKRYVPIPRKKTTEEEYKNRFWSKVKKGVPDDCWEWQAGKDQDGYGMFGLHRKSTKAHRYCYAILFGEIPVGMDVLHKCDNPPCCNPKHLFLGTVSDNMKDKARKGRGNAPRGENHGNVKLTERKVLEIRRLAKTNTLESVGKMFGISFQYVSQIKNLKRWSWLIEKENDVR